MFVVVCLLVCLFELFVCMFMGASLFVRACLCVCFSRSLVCSFACLLMCLFVGV